MRRYGFQSLVLGRSRVLYSNYGTINWRIIAPSTTPPRKLKYSGRYRTHNHTKVNRHRSLMLGESYKDGIFHFAEETPPNDRSLRGNPFPPQSPEIDSEFKLQHFLDRYQKCDMKTSVPNQPLVTTQVALQFAVPADLPEYSPDTLMCGHLPHEHNVSCVHGEVPPLSTSLQYQPGEIEVSVGTTLLADYIQAGYPDPVPQDSGLAVNPSGKGVDQRVRECLYRYIINNETQRNQETSFTATSQTPRQRA